MDELKAVFAGNLIQLRQKAGMTQAELGRQLSYSDKAISKWDRAEALPDAYVLMQMGRIFHVSVDYLLTEHDQWPGEPEGEDELQFSWRAVTCVTLCGVWTLAIFIFAVLWITGRILWLLLPCTVVVSLVTLLILNSVWNGGRRNMYIIMALVLSLLVLAYLLFFKLDYNTWQLFLVGIPAELMVFFSFRIKRSRDSREPDMHKERSQSRGK